MYFPKFIYELLPYIYFIVGVLSLFGLDPTGGKISGALLASAGAIIYKLRKDYRSGLA